jgi:hypothetical protein
MADFFPRHTIEWKVREPAFMRRLSLSLVSMALITGVAVHLYRWFVLSHGRLSWWFFFGAIGVGFTLMLGLTTAHLANYPVSQWVWRAPLFALVESAAEIAMSAVLIAGGVERVGSERAHWNDWLPLAFNTILRRLLAIVLFALLLALVVQWVRRMMLEHEG